MFDNFFTLDFRRIDWIRTGLLIVVVILAAALLKAVLMPEIKTIISTEFRRVPEIRTMETVKRVFAACPEQGVQILNKKDVAGKLNIDWLQGGDIASARTAEKEVQPSYIGGAQPFDFAQGKLSSELASVGTKDISPLQNPIIHDAQTEPDDVQVTATAELPESANGYQEVSVINLRTGESHIEAREKDSPWFKFQDEGALGLKYGINQKLEYVGTVYGAWDFLRMKNVWISANGSVETGGDAKLQLGVEYRW